MARSSKVAGRSVRLLRSMDGPSKHSASNLASHGDMVGPLRRRLAGEVPAAAGATEVLPADPDAVLRAVQVGAGGLPSQPFQRQRGLVPVPVADLAAHRADGSAPSPRRLAPLLTSYRHCFPLRPTRSLRVGLDTTRGVPQSAGCRRSTR